MRPGIATALAALALMSGCQPADEAVGWTADFNARYDVLANCLAARYGTSPRFYTSQRRADVPVANSPSRETEAEFQVSQVTEAISKVTWRRFTGGLFRGAMNRDEPVSSRSQADRCARPIQTSSQGLG
jgi:hypothetical protein